ncbi:MAG: twin-arginine translocase subunit TatC [SAR324 cluster bacterium]|nr:twin-arginine translocase subunit TatC [SAR324 cluster bacterium]
MPLSEHLAELRKRLIIASSFVFVGFMIASYIEVDQNQPILTIFRAPLAARNVPLVFDELTEPFFTYLRIGLYTSLFLSFPFILWQGWLFIKPALYPQEQKLFWPFLFVSYPLFIGGGLFGYFVVIPFGYDFFLGFQNAFTLPSLRMGDYLSLTIQLLFAFGMVFELPVITFFLARMGLVDSKGLKEHRQIAIVVIFIVAAILTPPDVFTQILMAGPLLVLYEISIVVAYFSERTVSGEDTTEKSDK